MKRLLINSLLGCMLMSQIQLQAWNPFSRTPRQWSIADFIDSKCYEVEDREQQEQCFEVKQFLLESRKATLENKPVVLESIACSVGGTISGFLFGAFLGAFAGDPSLGATFGAIAGLLSGPTHAAMVSNELHKKLPASMKFYAQCKTNPLLIKKTPKEVLDQLEYILKVTPEQRKLVVDNITCAWAARVIAAENA